MPDSEVPLKATRRLFGLDEILRILAEAYNVAGTGRGAEVLRCEISDPDLIEKWTKLAEFWIAL